MSAGSAVGSADEQSPAGRPASAAAGAETATAGPLSAMGGPLISVRNVSKTFAGTRALSGVSFDVGAGEIVAVIGRNGSGKSTLVKVIAGVYRPDPGSQVQLGDEGAPGGGGGAPGGGPVGLHVLHQELGLVSRLSAVENLGLCEGRGGAGYLPLRRRRERSQAEEMIGFFGASFDVTVPVGRLSAAERTIVALARALGRWTSPRNVLVLDEPTAALAPEEVGKLFGAVRRAAAGGAGVIFISHRLREVIELADRSGVLRDGRVVEIVRNAESSLEHLVELILGGVTTSAATGPDHREGPSLLRVENLRGGRVREASFEVQAGEVLGVAGLLGSGREELNGLVFGAKRRTGGTVSVAGTPAGPGHPRLSARRGIGFVSADRARDGVFMTLSARENLTLPHLRPLVRAFGRIDRAAEGRDAREWFASVELRPPEPERRLQFFSGGNQQKVLIARWLRARASVLLLDEPTQGVDLGGRAAIYELLASAARAGTAVVVSSSDAGELAELCDRVLVMHDGAVRVVLEGEALNEGAIERHTLDPDRAAGARQATS